MIERDLLNLLNDMLSRRDTRPVVITGPRFSGKSTLAALFGRKFATTLAFDLSKSSDYRVFRDAWEKPTFFSELFRIKGKIPGTGRTILILENISETLSLLAAIADHPQRPVDLFILATAGYVNEHVPHSERFVLTRLSPLTFKEFLNFTTTPDTLSLYMESPSPDHAYQVLLNHFHTFILLGGMPGIVNTWNDGGPPEELGAMYEEIMNGWMRDIGQSAPGRKSGKTAVQVFQEAFPFAATRIKYQRFSNLPYGSREVSVAFHLVEKLGLIRRIFPITGTDLTEVEDTGRSPRIQFYDTGMVTYFSGIRHQVSTARDMTVLFKGQVLRHVAGQEISGWVPGGGTPLNFWTRSKNQSTAEVDFVIPVSDILVPAVIANGEPGRLRSLHQFVDAAPHPYAVRLWANRLQIRQTETIKGKRYFLLSLPYYLAGRIPEHAEGMMKMVKW